MPNTIQPIEVLTDVKLEACRAVAGLVVNKGDLLLINGSTGRVDQILAAGNNGGASVVASHIALGNLVSRDTGLSTFAVDEELMLCPIRADLELVVSLSNDDAVVAWSNGFQGDKYTVRRTTAGVYCINTNVTTNPFWKVMAKVPGTESDLCGRVKANVLAVSRSLDL